MDNVAICAYSRADSSDLSLKYARNVFSFNSLLDCTISSQFGICPRVSHLRIQTQHLCQFYDSPV